MLQAHLQNAMLALRTDCPRVAVVSLQCALAHANKEHDNEAKAFIMRALNYARRVPAGGCVA